MSNLPTKHQGKALTRDEAFKNKLTALRKATGKIESFERHCACTATGNYFIVTYSRETPEAFFTISRIEKLDPAEAGKPGLLQAKRKAQHSRSYDVSEIDFSGWACPWCGDDGHSINCSRCDHLVCGARTRTLPTGQTYFRCTDQCGNSGTTVPCKTINGSSGGGGSSAKAQIAGPDRLRLTRHK